MMGSLGDPKDEAPARQEKEDDYHPSRVQEVFRHRFMGYVLSVTGFTGFDLSPGLTVTGFDHRV
jgi:hypothetical protein